MGRFRSWGKAFKVEYTHGTSQNPSISMYWFYTLFFVYIRLFLMVSLSHSLPRLSFCRRGNWITLKMRKLIKPKSRERMRSLTLTPSRSEYGDGFLTFPQDSQDSSSIGSGSNSLDDTLVHKRSSSEYKGNAYTRTDEDQRKNQRSYFLYEHTLTLTVYSTIFCDQILRQILLQMHMQRKYLAKQIPASSICCWILFHRHIIMHSRTHKVTKHTPTLCVCVWFVQLCTGWVVEWVFPALTAPLLLYLSLSAKGGEGSSPMPKGRVPPMVCCGWGGWAGFVTRLSHLSGHVFVSPLSVSLSCPRGYGWAAQHRKVDSEPRTWFEKEMHFLYLEQQRERLISLPWFMVWN